MVNVVKYGDDYRNHGGMENQRGNNDFCKELISVNLRDLCVSVVRFHYNVSNRNVVIKRFQVRYKLFSYLCKKKKHELY